jgi:hypothetical protein
LNFLYSLTDLSAHAWVISLLKIAYSRPFFILKLWLAQVGYERIEETEDPELAFDRAMTTYLKKGYSKKWINQRLNGFISLRQ